ncbi:MAG: SPASM domain-containing protein [Telmatospirillum sp.]|nr:SPASM domain-containing protein [Telmatospirillum sp.]
MINSDFHLVDTDAGVWALHAQSHRLFPVGDDIAREVRSRLSDRQDDGGALLALLARTDPGERPPANRHRLRAAEPVDGAPLAINVNLTATCNLGCTYCFADGGDYGRITGRLNTGSDVDDILAFARSRSRPGDTVRFEFFGGEPMLNFEVIETLCHRARTLGEEGRRVRHRISTNLTTALSDRELSLFDRFGFTVSVSIDGDEATHDRNRPNKGGRGSFRTVIDNCARVRRHSDAITLVARMTYVPLPGTSLLEDIRALHARNIFDWFQVLPANLTEQSAAAVIQKGMEGLTAQAILEAGPDRIDAEYETLSAAYPRLFQDGNRFRGLLEIELLTRMILKGEIANGHCSAGRRYFTLSPDRSVMPCHRLVGNQDFRVAFADTPVDEDRLAPWRRSVDDTPACAGCPIRYLCAGGCKQENLVATGQLDRPDPRKCRFQFRLVDSAVRAIAAGGAAYRDRDRSPLADLFVSCGRPVLSSGDRTEAFSGPGIRPAVPHHPPPLPR